MRSATESLTAKDIKGARPREEAALRGLIAARRNLRKLLSQSQSSCAAPVDRSTRNSSRGSAVPPPTRRRSSLLAWKTTSRSSQSGSRSSRRRSRPRGAVVRSLTRRRTERSRPRMPASRQRSRLRRGPGRRARGARARPSQQQRQAAEEAERLRQLASRDDALTDLTNRRLADASDAVQQSSRSAESGREAQAAAEARDAARKLESVARQVGALKAGELADRLARQRDLAQAIAMAERELGRALARQTESKGSGPDATQFAGKQRELADEVAALADVLGRLKLAAAEAQPELAQDIGRATRANPPEEVEDAMRQNAAAIGEGRAGPAARSADRAAGQLEALAQDLESIRRATIQPQLERLLAAEKQAAELQERLRSVRQTSQQAEAEKAISDLARRLDDMSAGDGAPPGRRQALRRHPDRCRLDPEPPGRARSGRLFRPPDHLHRSRGGRRRGAAGADPGDHARQRADRTERSGAAPVQGTGRGLLPGPVAGPAIELPTSAFTGRGDSGSAANKGRQYESRSSRRRARANPTSAPQLMISPVL